VKKRLTASIALKTLGLIALALGLASCAGSATASEGLGNESEATAGTASARTGLIDGAFLPCPGSPNCVSSMETEGTAFIEPIRYGTLSRGQALDRLLALLKADDNCRIVEQKELQDGGMYVRAEYRSKLFRFVDDVEFLLAPESGIIQVRSASRVGYSDMGVNRKRVEELRARFTQG
jgi:uncharacterized protein (DUF1499 family)